MLQSTGLVALQVPLAGLVREGLLEQVAARVEVRAREAQVELVARAGEVLAAAARAEVPEEQLARAVAREEPTVEQREQQEQLVLARPALASASLPPLKTGTVPCCCGRAARQPPTAPERIRRHSKCCTAISKS